MHQTCDILLFLDKPYPYIFMLAGKFEYDLVVIGGGSGGLACAKEGKDTHRE